MISFFQQAIEFFKLIVDFIGNILESLVMVVSQIPKWLAFTHVLFAYLPPLLLPFAVFSIFLSVAFLIIGRN